MAQHRFGPVVDADGVTFRLWAPGAQSVDLMLDRPQPMTRADDGWFVHRDARARAGTRYKFRIDGGTEVPDPASAFQPDDVHGPSEVIDHDYAWQAGGWRGRPWSDAVILELHVGTFTEQGTYRAIIDKLDHIVEAGFTAIELMPLADFAGPRNWGYDGVLLYAPDNAYGRPEDLKALIDAAHARGLMVFLDVVYNHFGPEGNYLGLYAPQFFTDRHRTPWGDAIDYNAPEVRAYAIENALHWLRDYRFDGLRLDAVHAIVERGTPSVLQALSEAVGELARAEGRHIHLILENDDNEADLLDPLTDPARGRYRAQWNDDYHHVWHVLLTGEQHGYYGDYVGDTRAQLARALASGYVYQGDPSGNRRGEPRGQPSAHLPPAAFINFIQNHDQIGNRPYGERLAALAPAEGVAAALAVMLLSPHPPMLFMGDEWGSTRPFPFFCSFTGELADAVRKGRREEFKAAYEHAERGHEPPDPLDEATFRDAVLDWDNVREPEHAQRLKLLRDLLAVRRAHVVPLLAANGDVTAEADFTGPVLRARWTFGNGKRLAVVANLGAEPAAAPADAAHGTPIWNGAADAELRPWAVHWSVGER